MHKDINHEDAHKQEQEPQEKEQNKTKPANKSMSATRVSATKAMTRLAVGVAHFPRKKMRELKRAACQRVARAGVDHQDVVGEPLRAYSGATNPGLSPYAKSCCPPTTKKLDKTAPEQRSESNSATNNRSKQRMQKWLGWLRHRMYEDGRGRAAAAAYRELGRNCD